MLSTIADSSVLRILGGLLKNWASLLEVPEKQAGRTAYGLTGYWVAVATSRAFRFTGRQ